MTVDFEPTYKEQLQAEIEATPDEYLPALLEIVQAFLQSVVLRPATNSFRQGWQETVSGQTLPLSELWQDVEDERHHQQAC